VRLIFAQIDFKNVSGYLPLADAYVIFGPNDSGKTNLLEGVAILLAENFGERGHQLAHLRGRFTWELDGLDAPGITIGCGSRISCGGASTATSRRTWTPCHH
jgi:energy-coupling factor transporter ATP-binding protein EcfA2